MMKIRAGDLEATRVIPVNFCVMKAKSCPDTGPMAEILFSVLVTLESVLLLLVLVQIFREDIQIWPPPIEKSAATLLCALGIFYFLIVGSIWLCVLQWTNTVLDYSWIRYLGGMLLGLGLVLYGWSRMYMSKKVEFGNKDRLITEGPYRFTRNPLYVADTFIFVGFALIGNSLLMMILMALLVKIILLLPLIEEPWLLKQYGNQYRDYLEKTPRYF